jgi:hypothetical protein
LRFTPEAWLDASSLIAGRSSAEELSSESELSESSFAGVTGFFAAAGDFTAGGGCDLFRAFARTGCDEAFGLETLGLAAKVFCFKLGSFFDFVMLRVGCESPSLSESTMRSWLSAVDFFLEVSAALAMIARSALKNPWCWIGKVVSIACTSIAYEIQGLKKVWSFAKILVCRARLGRLPTNVIHSAHFDNSNTA